MKPLRLALLALVLAACSSVPTAVDVGGPSFEEAREPNMIGSGNRSEGDAVGATTQSDTTGRGGSMIGSGN